MSNNHNGSVSIELESGKADINLWPHGNVTAINIRNREAPKASWNFWVLENEQGQAVSHSVLNNTALEQVFNHLVAADAITQDAFRNKHFMENRIAMEFNGQPHVLVCAPEAVTQVPVDASKLGNHGFWQWPDYNK